MERLCFSILDDADYDPYDPISLIDGILVRSVQVSMTVGGIEHMIGYLIKIYHVGVESKSA